MALKGMVSQPFQGHKKRVSILARFVINRVCLELGMLSIFLEEGTFLSIIICKTIM